MGKIAAPEPISASHLIDSFSCGTSVLDEWLKRRALKNEDASASRTFIVCQANQVIGFYTLATV
jgi:hypothetical protein